MIEWITNQTQNLIIATAIASSFIGAVYLWARDKIKNIKTNKQIKGLKEDVDIANEPPKSHSELVEWLRRGE